MTCCKATRNLFVVDLNIVNFSFFESQKRDIQNVHDKDIDQIYKLNCLGRLERARAVTFSFVKYNIHVNTRYELVHINIYRIYNAFLRHNIYSNAFELQDC